MIWIFVSVVLALMVYHPGFRKVAFVIGGVAALASALVVLWAINHDQAMIQQTTKRDQILTTSPTMTEACPKLAIVDSQYYHAVCSSIDGYDPSVGDNAPARALPLAPWAQAAPVK